MLKRLDPKLGLFLIKLISDKAEQKGTGRWALQAAVDLRVATSSIDAAVTSRIISTYKELRTSLSLKLGEARIINNVKMSEALLLM